MHPLIFLAPTQRLAPQLAATPWGGSPPRPLRQKICYSDCTKNCPLCPLGAPKRFRNPKTAQHLGAHPTPRFRGLIEAIIKQMMDALIHVDFAADSDQLDARHLLPPTSLIR